MLVVRMVVSGTAGNGVGCPEGARVFTKTAEFVVASVASPVVVVAKDRTTIVVVVLVVLRVVTGANGTGVGDPEMLRVTWKIEFNTESGTEIGLGRDARGTEINDGSASVGTVIGDSSSSVGTEIEGGSIPVGTVISAGWETVGGSGNGLPGDSVVAGTVFSAVLSSLALEGVKRLVV